jgi:hypothetical protein
MAPEELLVKRLQYGGLIAMIVIPLLMLAVNEYNWRPQPQPIAFNHELHAGTRQIACVYCHRGTQNGYFAGVPSVQDCNNCHQNFPNLIPYKQDKDGKYDPTQQKWVDEIGKLQNYVKGKQAIPWFKNYDLPEHVKFAHKAHLNANLANGTKIDCAQCHGDVKTMPVIQLQGKTTMGWCVTCHRENGAPTDCTTCHR